ncbi:hypothetical protein AVEN_42137-1 [Araneus ventricosus]|uniref:Uncharacterized protein n=1 Tax=Araneus ventricosus TaxID=182803 RepID=A0A4Y2D2G6_ARAVE|nr:hypothetical protein AVEN_42137-1 [Araneus ventricosus]
MITTREHLNDFGSNLNVQFLPEDEDEIIAGASLFILPCHNSDIGLRWMALRGHLGTNQKVMKVEIDFDGIELLIPSRVFFDVCNIYKHFRKNTANIRDDIKVS